MVAAADRQRARAAAELRQDVEAPLRVAQSELVAMRAAVHDPEVAAAVEVVVQELAAATGELADLVAGIPPADLGGGRLGRALQTPRPALFPSRWPSPTTRPAACAQLFRKLGLEPSPDLNRRVLAVLTLLRS